jgi:hypothetical protein
MKTKANPFPKSLADLTKPELRRLLKQLHRESSDLDSHWFALPKSVREIPFAQLSSHPEEAKLLIKLLRRRIAIGRKVCRVIRALHPARRNRKTA